MSSLDAESSAERLFCLFSSRAGRSELTGGMVADEEEGLKEGGSQT